MLTDYDQTRYARQTLIHGWGDEGQRKLKEATVVVVGAGGLGSPMSIYLAVAGVGHIVICDADKVELSNLNRQILHSDARIGHDKADSAAQTLRELNPAITITSHRQRIDSSNIARIVGKPAIIVDCLDNYETRYLLNTYAIEVGVPLVHGAIWGLLGQVTFIQPPQTPCLRCLAPEPPPKSVFPVLGATPGLIGCIQAMEVLKYLTGVGQNLRGRLLFIDGEDMSFNTLTFARVPNCPACGHLG